jgi:cytosine/adenosine deaminase-related metal-dependent hydrolase
MMLRARIVVTMDGAPIENGAVAISGNRIVDVGTFDGVKARNSGEVVDLGEQALLPGLINAHCHLDYTCLRGKISPQKSFADWIRAILSEKAKLSPANYVTSIKEGFAEAKKFGTTTIANLTAFPELIAKIDEPIRTWWFAELIDVREPHRAKEIDDSPPGSSPSRAARLRRSAPAGSVVDLAVERLKSKKNWGLAPHAPFTASANLYRRCEEVARRENVLLTTHLAESREEMTMFRDASGPLYEFMKEFGRDMSDCGQQPPLIHFLTMRDSSTALRSTRNDKKGARNDNEWIIAHLNELTESDFDLLERSTTRFPIVHSPRSHDYFAHATFPFERLRSLGCNICLGTDSLASNEDLSLFAEMRYFQKSEPGIAPEQILSMVTSNAALALGKPHVLGRLGAGYWADMVAIPFSGLRENVFEEIVALDAAVTMSMVDGEMS